MTVENEQSTGGVGTQYFAVLVSLPVGAMSLDDDKELLVLLVDQALRTGFHSQAQAHDIALFGN